MSKDKNKKKSELNLDDELMIPMSIEAVEQPMSKDGTLFELINLYDHLVRLRNKFMEEDKNKVARGVNIAVVELNSMIKNIEKHDR
tara:strand:+ start:2760 stop:3017 length:258 start_codon:yes stop_codon:yes gene_type:complete